MARPRLLTRLPIARLARAWRRMRATGGSWRDFARFVLPALLLCTGGPVSPAAACEIAPMADCRGAVLTGIDLRRRNLRGVDFSGADLSDADLSGADLAGARLSGAIARRAGFEKAFLGNVLLDGADLAGARLRPKDILASTSLAGARMPDDATVCRAPSQGECTGAAKPAFRPKRRR